MNAIANMPYLFVIFVAVFGASLVLLGMRGRRIDDHPVCRKCRYDLFGLDAPRQCPECGAELSDHRAIRIGHRRRRPIAIACGLLLITIACGLGVMSAARFDPTPHKPVWLLVLEAERGGTDRAQAARAEFLRRLSAGTLSNQQIARIAEAGLRAQRDMDTPWETDWGEFIEGAWMAGRLSDEHALTFYRFGFGASFSSSVRPVVRAGRPIPWRYHSQINRLSRTQPMVVVTNRPGALVRIIGVTRNDEMIWQPNWRAPHGRLGPRIVMVKGGMPLDVQLEPGVHTITLLYEFEVRYLRLPGEIPPRIAPPLFAWQRSDVVTIEVIAEGEPIIALAADPSLEDAIRESMKVTIVKGSYEDKWHVHMGGSVDVTDPPVDLSFDVFARYNGEERLLGGFAASTASIFPGHEHIDHPRAVWPEARFVDLIFRTNPEHAERTVDIEEVWDGEIIMRDVPVIAPPYPSDPDEQEE